MDNLTFPVYSFSVTFLILSVIMVVRYYVMSYIFNRLTNSLPRLNEGEIFRETVINEMKASLLSSLIFAFFATVLIKSWQGGWSKIYLNLQDYPLWYLPLSFLLYLFLHDMYFYWTHRLFHKPRLIKFHMVHHISRNPTAWTSFAFHPFEALIQALFIPVMVFILPIHVTVLGLHLLLMSVFGVTNHLGREIYPSWIEKKFYLITATHHQKHHQSMSVNYGLYFTWWDLLFQTEQKDKQ